MNLFSKIIITAALLLSTSVFAGWNNVEHPFEELTIERGDRSHTLGTTDMFWVRVLVENKEKHYALANLWVECEVMNYFILFRETNMTKDNKVVQINTPSKVKSAGEYDILYYPIKDYCNSRGDSMCYPEENLDRTHKEELVDMLTSELRDEDGN